MRAAVVVWCEGLNRAACKFRNFNELDSEIQRRDRTEFYTLAGNGGLLGSQGDGEGALPRIDSHFKGAAGEDGNQ